MSSRLSVLVFNITLGLKNMDFSVKVYNRNKFDHKELFQGKDVLILAGKHVVMEYDDAHKFLGQMFNIKLDKGGQQDPRSFKWLEMDKEDKRRCELLLRNESEEKAKKVFVCHSCGDEFKDKKTLLKHIKDEHLDDLVDEDAKEQLED